ncbi:hypothetical protein L3X38_003903 [Prunus dulcis]|uniref:Uncharacterized protein n=1 Tax=Prunus dulcis TaxID=3755 RepID=A0AAD4ZMZ5_PRUDU|nr:hypothetical protein L3X38_003903 [Prunus dulcis]
MPRYGVSGRQLGFSPTHLGFLFLVSISYTGLDFWCLIAIYSPQGGYHAKIGAVKRVLGKLEDGRLSCFKWQLSLGDKIANFQLKFSSMRRCRRILLMC